LQGVKRYPAEQKQIIMAGITSIQWTDSTVNFWMGCKKVSEGCKFCYMYRNQSKNNVDPTAVRRTSYETFYKAHTWTKPRKIFTCSYSDFFIEEADDWRNEAWEVIKNTPQHQWQILTKRIERVKDHLPDDWGPNGYPNVWLGVTVENQKFLSRVEKLKEIPAAVKFISAEPLIGEIKFNDYRPDLIKGIDWIIVGGESGNEFGEYRYRNCELDWIESIINEAKEYDVKVFVKQFGSDLAKRLKLKDKFGGDPNEWDSKLRVLQFPKYNLEVV
jgi:protein gp37